MTWETLQLLEDFLSLSDFIRFCQVRQKMDDIIYSAREFYFQEFHFINFSNLALNDLSLHRFPQFLIRKGKFISKWCTVHCEENYAPSFLRFLWTELTFLTFNNRLLRGTYQTFHCWNLSKLSFQYNNLKKSKRVFQKVIRNFKNSKTGNSWG